jgi:membrane protein DedA with SNARE-associated domain
MDHSLLAELIQQYGYLAVLIGAVLEGETVLLIAGFAAHRGYLDLAWVVAVAAAGGFLGDQAFYWLGRARGQEVIARWPSLRTRIDTVQELLHRHDAWIVVGMRFMYGLRIAGPVILGMTGVGAVRFAAFNLLGALLWAGLVGGAGYLFGQALELVLQDVEHYEALVLAVLAALGLGFWIYRRLTRRTE